MATDDFITINEQPVRLTSLKRNESALALVVIVRGDAARDELTRLLNLQPLRVKLQDEEQQIMRVAGLDLRSSGEGARTIHRLAIALEPTLEHTEPDSSSPVVESALMQRLEAIERKVDTLIALLGECRLSGKD